MFFDGQMEINLYHDLMNLQQVNNYRFMRPYESTVMNFLRRVHTSMKIAKCFDLPYKHIWYQSLFDMIEKDSCIIFSTMSLTRLSLKELRKIQNHINKPKMVLLIIDSLHAHSPHLEFAMDKIFHFNWDLILSFDEHDCSEFGFKYLGMCYYSDLLRGIPQGTINSDLYYVGADKGNRGKLVREIYDKARKKQVHCNFFIVTSNDQQAKSGMRFSQKWIPYSAVLKDVGQTNCVLEVLQEGQQTQSVRYFEAVCYNKKLLTNNPNLSKLPFYDSRFMRYFKEIDDIDFDWIQKVDRINYGYNNEFSPKQILLLIEKFLFVN